MKYRKLLEETVAYPRRMNRGRSSLETTERF
jgi:hypothetical protein